jgi:hypothetical protein
MTRVADTSLRTATRRLRAGRHGQPLLGGQQEPGHGAGLTLLGLLSRPDQLRRVAEDKTLVPRAINEGLRWCAPIWTTLGRCPFRNVERAGRKLPCGPLRDRGSFKIAVLRAAAGGGGSQYVHVLKEGSQVRVRGPRNPFALIEAPRSAATRRSSWCCSARGSLPRCPRTRRFSTWSRRTG